MAWKKRLDEYYEKYKYNFIVQKLLPFPHPWLNYNTKEYKEFIKKEGFVTQREVFYDEVVYDVDMDKEMHPISARVESQKIAREISNRLKDVKITHSVWSSGGTGAHIHAFFPELNGLNTINNRITKKIILREYGRGFLRPREGGGKVQLQTNTTIQLEAAPHRKGGNKRLLWEVHFEEPNKLELWAWNELEEEKKRNNLMTKYFKDQLKEKKPDAISFLENEKFVNIKDGRDRALFILTAYYKQFLKEDELLLKLIDWNKSILGGYFSERTIKSKIRSARPCLPINYLIELFDELGIDQKYFSDLKKVK